MYLVNYIYNLQAQEIYDTKYVYLKLNYKCPLWSLKAFTNKDKVYKLIKFKSILIDQDIKIFSKKIKSTHVC